MSRRIHIGHFVSSIIIVALTAVSFQAFGQETWEKEGAGEIKDMEIEITKDRQIILPRANRYFEKVPPRPFEPIMPAITYDVRKFSFATPNYTPTIRPLRLKQEELGKLYGNYISGGIGNYQSFFVEGSIATKRDKSKLIGADFYWRGFGKGPVDDNHSANSNTRLRIFGKKVTQAVTTSGDLSYNNDRGYFYGYTPGTDVDREKFKQVYETFAVKGAVENTKKGEFNYRLNGGYSYLRDAYVATEGEVSLGFLGDYKLSDTSHLSLAIDLFLINRKDSLYTQSRNLIRIQPAYTFVPMDKLTITAGLNLAISNDIYPGSSDFRLYPHVKGRYAASDRVSLYAVVTGNLDKVSLHTLAAENFWLNSNNPMGHTNRAMELEGGMEAAVGSKFNVRLGASYASMKNMYFYQANRGAFDLAGISVGVPFNSFDLVYDGTTSRFNPYAEATVMHSQVFRTTLRVDYFQYNTELIARAWHRPSYRGDLRMFYNLYGKIFFQAGLIMQGGMKALDPVTSLELNLDAAVDLNFRARYFFSRQISAFIQLDNMLAKEYPIYLSYPSRGFQALVGATWSF